MAVSHTALLSTCANTDARVAPSASLIPISGSRWLDRVPDRSVDRHPGEGRGQRRRREEQQHRAPRLRERRRDPIVHRSHVVERQVRVDRLDVRTRTTGAIDAGSPSSARPAVKVATGGLRVRPIHLRHGAAAERDVPHVFGDADDTDPWT